EGHERGEAELGPRADRHHQDEEAHGATMVRAPAALARARATAGAGAERRGSTAVRRPATSRPGTSMPRLPAGPKPMRSAVSSGGPSAMPTLPPVEKIETPVVLRSPATAVAVR